MSSHESAIISWERKDERARLWQGRVLAIWPAVRRPDVKKKDWNKYVAEEGESSKIEPESQVQEPEFGMDEGACENILL